MALIHEKLYQSADLTRVNFAGYLRSLVSSLGQSYRENAGRVMIQVDAEEFSLDIETAIPCGLIVNELVSNALKHAFPDGRSGKIRVVITSHGHDRLCLQVNDTGVGFPADLDYRNSQSLGLQLVHSLAKQIDGFVEMESREGTHFAIDFAVPVRGSSVWSIHEHASDKRSRH